MSSRFKRMPQLKPDHLSKQKVPVDDEYKEKVNNISIVHSVANNI